MSVEVLYTLPLNEKIKRITVTRVNKKTDLLFYKIIIQNIQNKHKQSNNLTVHHKHTFTNLVFTFN